MAVIGIKLLDLLSESKLDAFCLHEKMELLGVHLNSFVIK